MKLFAAFIWFYLRILPNREFEWEQPYYLANLVSKQHHFSHLSAKRIKHCQSNEVTSCFPSRI